MRLSERELQVFRKRLDEHESIIQAWPPELPDPLALRCSDSRHRTLAHLRACGEVWLQASLAFAQIPGTSTTLPHPWQVFDREGYASVPWDDHLRAFVQNREAWRELLAFADPESGGVLNGNRHTVASLFRRLVLHEESHLFPAK